jgi:hypothetical protein
VAALLERGQQRVYVGPARTTVGMPCGALCAGQLYVLGDGSLGCWQIDGNTYFSGVGHDSYATYRPAQPVAQGFAVGAADPTGNVTRATLDDTGYDGIEFVGEYPRAIIRYRAKSTAAPPVRVDLEVFSPFVPLSARDSAWPATVLRFTVANPTDQPLDVTLGGWLQNSVFGDQTPGEQRPSLFYLRRNRVVIGDGLTSVLMDTVEHRPAPPERPITRVLADFESGGYEGWTVTGQAFGERPAGGTHPNQQSVTGFGGQYLVNSFTAGDQPTGKMVSDPFEIDLPYLTFRIGGGRHAGKTCLNLVIDDRVVRTATGRNAERLELRAWDVSEFLNRRTHLEIVDDHSGGWGHINVDDIALTNTLPDGLRESGAVALGLGNVALSLVGSGTACPQWPGQAAFTDSLGSQGAQGQTEAESRLDQPLVGTVTARLSLPASWNLPGESFPKTFYVEGVGGSATPRDVTVQLTLDYQGCQCSDEAKLSVIDTDLTLHNGQGGSGVAQNLQEKTGAFTVANLNDTDNDGTADDGDNDVRAATGGPDGRDELDLMELNIARPSPDFGGHLRVRVNGSARLWEHSYKGTEIGLSGGAVDLATSSLPKTVWVELPSGSGSLRNVEIGSQYMGVNEIDVVKATGIWVTGVDSKHDAGDSHWSDITTPPKNLIDALGGYGLRLINPTNGVRNVIGVRFQLSPGDVWHESNVYFDMSRSADGKVWEQDAGGTWMLVDSRTFPTNMEAANDDYHNNDESPGASDPQGGFFSMDAPGYASPYAPSDRAMMVWRANFNEFMRIAFTSRPSGSTLSGSRCSPYYGWHLRHRVYRDGATGMWARTTGDASESSENDIAPGHIEVGQNP